MILLEKCDTASRENEAISDKGLGNAKNEGVFGELGM